MAPTCADNVGNKCVACMDCAYTSQAWKQHAGPRWASCTAWGEGGMEVRWARYLIFTCALHRDDRVTLGPTAPRAVNQLPRGRKMKEVAAKGGGQVGQQAATKHPAHRHCWADVGVAHDGELVAAVEEDEVTASKLKLVNARGLGRARQPAGVVGAHRGAARCHFHHEWGRR